MVLASSYNKKNQAILHLLYVEIKTKYVLLPSTEIYANNHHSHPISKEKANMPKSEICIIAALEIL